MERNYVPGERGGDEEYLEKRNRIMETPVSKGEEVPRKKQIKKKQAIMFFYLGLKVERHKGRLRGEAMKPPYR